ncbi:universal stress protein [Cellulomonas endophytica]|uniref:universal stress protein n=1 Tax=Cellulomonas endophytica TaxID=2494735 RepID=UPI001013A63C|nr:universal stress protein [Cellulomonas endophytica]
MGRDGTVLVGVDGSAPGTGALRWAAAEALRHGWGLRLVCSYALPAYATALDGGFGGFDDSVLERGAKETLADAAAWVDTQGIPVTTELAAGDAAGVLVDLSREVALTVVGTRGRGGFADRLLGTLSSALPAHAHSPTVVVPLRRPLAARPDEAVGGLFGPERGGATVGSADVLLPTTGSVPVVPWEDAPAGPADVHDGTPAVRSIVVGVDGSRQAVRALRYALAEAEAWGAELTAVAAVPLAASAGVLAWLPAVTDHEQILAESAERLDAVVDEVLLDHPGVRVRRIVLDGTGAQLLTEFSTATDLVVVGSRGRGGFSGLLLGSTSQAVLHHARCAVMVVTDRADDRPARRAR